MHLPASSQVAPFSHKTKADERSDNPFSHKHRLKPPLVALCSINSSSSNQKQQASSLKIQLKFHVSSLSLPTKVIGLHQKKNLKSFKLLPPPIFNLNFRHLRTSTHQRKPTLMREAWQKQQAVTTRAVLRLRHHSPTQVNVIVYHT